MPTARDTIRTALSEMGVEIGDEQVEAAAERALDRVSPDDGPRALWDAVDDEIEDLKRKVRIWRGEV